MSSAPMTRQEPDRTRSPAEWFCLLGGVSLAGAGIWGFFLGEIDWRTGDSLGGPEVLGLFEVNGWHNLVHVATGALLLATMSTTASARYGALAFASAYALVTVWGFIDGNDVANVIPVNTADNVLHGALAGVGFLAYAASETRAQTKPPSARDREGRFGPAPVDEARPRERARGL